MTTPPSLQEQAREILPKLSEAQRRRLLMLRHEVGSNRCQAFSGYGNAACIALVDLGIAHRVGDHGLGGAYQITQFGLAVRALLQTGGAE